jgi:hypothetical protein
MRVRNNRILYVAMLVGGCLSTLVLAGGYLAGTKGRRSTQAAGDLAKPLHTNAVASDMVPEEGTTMTKPALVAAPNNAGTTTAAADGDGIGAGSAVPTQQMEGIDDVRRDEAEFKKSLGKPAASNKEKLASCHQVHGHHEKFIHRQSS